MSIDRDPLRRRMTTYFDRSMSWAGVTPSIGGLSVDAAEYPARDTRERLLGAGCAFDAARLRRYALFPFDNRFVYWDPTPPLWNRARPELAEQAWPGSRFLVCRLKARRPDEGRPTAITSAIPDQHFLDPNVVAIPLQWRSTAMGDTRTTANLAPAARAYLSELGVGDADSDDQRAGLLWHHALATTYSPAYLAENGAAVRADYPRLPLPADLAVLQASAALGRELADLLDPDVEVPGVTVSPVRPDLRAVGTLRRADGGQIDPAGGDLAVTVGWGALQRETVVMPGRGRLTAAARPDATPLGGASHDVWLNGDVYWHQVPAEVWGFTIGGYPVLKKWLSYREKEILGRDLTLDEARHVTAMVRRLAAIVLLGPKLDEGYRASVADHTPLQS